MRQFFRNLIVVGIIAYQDISFAREPLNLSRAKADVIQYYNSGEYISDFTKVINFAQGYLENRYNQNRQLPHPRQLAIVFDIDETTLSNYVYLLATDFCFTAKSIQEGLLKSDGKPFEASFRLYQYAIDHHIAVFFVTGRREFLADATIRNLRRAGYQHYVRVYFKPNNYTLISVSPYKTQMRKQISEQGYDIVENIGDQESDLKGGYADRIYKLPNPFYFIP